MIDKSKTYWVGDSAADIDEYLKAYTDRSDLEVHPVLCDECGSDCFEIEVDQEEGAVLVRCTKCGEEKLLLDSEEYWEDCDPQPGICSVCEGKEYNIRVGFLRRKNGSIEWIFIGNRCTDCGVLGSYTDWGIDFEPTDWLEEML